MAECVRRTAVRKEVNMRNVKPSIDFIAAIQDRPLSDPAADFADSVKIERWHIGIKAFYESSWLGKQSYLPLTEIRKAFLHDFPIKGGCSCAGNIPAAGVAIEYDGGSFKIIPAHEKNVQKIIDTLKERIPGLDTEIPDIYKGRTRDPL